MRRGASARTVTDERGLLAIDPGQRGCITTEHSVWCAGARADLPFRAKGRYPDGCNQRLQVTEPYPASLAKQAGWRYTRKYGWLCQPCGEKWEAAGRP